MKIPFSDKCQRLETQACRKLLDDDVWNWKQSHFLTLSLVRTQSISQQGNCQRGLLCQQNENWQNILLRSLFEGETLDASLWWSSRSYVLRRGNVKSPRVQMNIFRHQARSDNPTWHEQTTACLTAHTNHRAPASFQFKLRHWVNQLK